MPVLVFSVLYVPHHWRQAGATRLEEIVFGTVQRVVLSTGAALILYACSMGYGGLFDKLCSLRIIVPVGRYCLSMWMAHFLYIWYEMFTIRRPIDGYKFAFLARVLHCFAWAICLGWIIYIFIEAPFVNLSKSLFGVKKEPQLDKNANTTRKKTA